jgi:beta-lactamase regulating signal transducer with metallopeptidase domain
MGTFRLVVGGKKKFAICSDAFPGNISRQPTQNSLDMPSYMIIILWVYSYFGCFTLILVMGMEADLKSRSSLRTREDRAVLHGNQSLSICLYAFADSRRKPLYIQS